MAHSENRKASHSQVLRERERDRGQSWDQREEQELDQMRPYKPCYRV